MGEELARQNAANPQPGTPRVARIANRSELVRAGTCLQFFDVRAMTAVIIVLLVLLFASMGVTVYFVMKARRPPEPERKSLGDLVGTLAPLLMLL